jgi:hypothetical protein
LGPAQAGPFTTTAQGLKHFAILFNRHPDGSLSAIPFT